MFCCRMSFLVTELELNSDQIDKALAVLALIYGKVFGGFVATGYGQYVSCKSMPRFKAIKNIRFIQILNVGDHWICATNCFTKNFHDVFIYDSAYTKISNSLHVQMSSILRGIEEPDEITYHIRNYQRQSDGSRMCGFYAVAAAVSVANNTDPTQLLFKEENMLASFHKLLEGDVSEWPSTKLTIKKKTVATEVLKKVHCLCQKPSAGEMIQCKACLNWFHIGTCIELNASQKTIEKMDWFGPCCNPVEAASLDVSSDQ